MILDSSTYRRSLANVLTPTALYDVISRMLCYYDLQHFYVFHLSLNVEANAYKKITLNSISFT